MTDFLDLLIHRVIWQRWENDVRRFVQLSNESKKNFRTPTIIGNTISIASPLLKNPSHSRLRRVGIVRFTE